MTWLVTWLGTWLGRCRRGQVATQLVATQFIVLLPVVVVAGLSMLPPGPSSARSRSVWSQSVRSGASPAIVTAQNVSTPDTRVESGADAKDGTKDGTEDGTKGDATGNAKGDGKPASKSDPTGAAAPDAAAPEAPPAAAPPVNGLKISWQSWRRGGLGSNALVSFTLRNNNDYAVKDVEIACAFARRDGSHLTDRNRVIPGTIRMKSRKTFARVHVGFVNINANKAKCLPVAASRI